MTSHLKSDASTKMPPEMNDSLVLYAYPIERRLRTVV
jgi:hypothetical protein